MFWSKKDFLVLIFLSTTVLSAQILLEGDSAAAANTSFSFNVLKKYLNNNTFDLYVGRNDATDAGAATDVKNYALSVIKAGTTAFIPLSPAQAWVNGVENSDNPLHGEKISQLGYFSQGPLVVRADALQHLYYLASGASSNLSSVLKIENVKDAQGASASNGSTTSGIVRIAGSSNYAFAAVGKNGSTFGVVGAGIALIKEIKNGLEQIAAVTGDTGIKALPLDPSSSELKITTNLASIDATIVDMYWDDILQRLYICVKATGAGGATDGALGVVVGYVEVVDGAPKLKFSAFAPASSAVFNNQTYIVGGIGADTVTEIQQVKTMHTSAGTSYLITLGNAASSKADQTVSALPLVNKKPASVYADNESYLTDPEQGTLASKTVNAGINLKEYFKSNKQISYFVGRGFQVAASVTADLTIQTDKAAQVGGDFAPGIVLDMRVYKDAVFISVSGNDDEAQVYSSQALLDGAGAIKAWTPWRPVMRPVTTANRVYGLEYQPAVGRLYTMEGSSSSAVNIVKTSIWSQGLKDGLLGGTTSDNSVGFESLLSSAFLQENGGIQGLLDFPKETVAFSQTEGQRLSMMVATGYKKIMLIETGQDNGSSKFTPNIGSFFSADNIAVTNGALDVPRTANTKIITISGGVLDTVGAISTATILWKTSATASGYLVIGGVGGVAILRASGGTGWTSKLQKSFENIGTDLSFEIIGNYSHVRKVVADGQFLYVLTNKTFDRIPASQLTGTITPTVLATPADLGLASFDSFSDVVVSSKLALLATSRGLYRVGNGKDISTETSASAVDWTLISFTEGPAAVTRLVPVGTTSLEYDFAQQNGGGMVYVLASSVGEQLSAVYRLAIRNISSAAIDATTVEQIPDDILSTVVGPYAHIGSYRNYFTTDGALPVVTRSYYNVTAAVAQAFPSSLTAGARLRPRTLAPLPLIAGQNEIGKLVTNSALGSKIIPTDDGSLILE